MCKFRIIYWWNDGSEKEIINNVRIKYVIYLIIKRKIEKN